MGSRSTQAVHRHERTWSPELAEDDTTIAQTTKRWADRDHPYPVLLPPTIWPTETGWSRPAALPECCA